MINARTGKKETPIMMSQILNQSLQSPYEFHIFALCRQITIGMKRLPTTVTHVTIIVAIISNSIPARAQSLPQQK